MSTAERTFFSLRYAVPGYTSILIFILLAYPALEKIVLPSQDVTFIAALLAFLSLLGGGALGFLVSQVWYVLFDRCWHANYGRIRETRRLLTTEYGLDDSKEKHTHQIIFLDYVQRLSAEEGMKGVTQRLYDLMHVFGSTLFSVSISSFFGVLVRVYYTEHTSAYDLPAILIIASLMLLLYNRLKHTSKEHGMAVEVLANEIVSSGGLSKHRARQIFPREYFKNEEDDDG